MSEYDTSQGNTIEFNSMVAVLKRLDTITIKINIFRGQRDLKNMLDCIIDYFKEIAPDLSTTEIKILDDINEVRDFVALGAYSGKSGDWVLRKLDDIDLKLRVAAKKHGYLTKSQKDAGRAILEF